MLDKAPQHTPNDVTDLLQVQRMPLSHIFRRACPSSMPEGCWSRLKGEPFVYRYYSSINERMDAVMEFLRVTGFNFDIQKFLFRDTIAITVSVQVMPKF